MDDMPDLPGLPGLSPEHFDRIVAAFPGATAAEKTASYRRWLTNRLIERVHAVESSRIEAEITETRKRLYDELAATLPPRVADPPLG